MAIINRKANNKYQSLSRILGLNKDSSANVASNVLNEANAAKDYARDKTNNTLNEIGTSQSFTDQDKTKLNNQLSSGGLSDTSKKKYEYFLNDNYVDNAVDPNNVDVSPSNLNKALTLGKLLGSKGGQKTLLKEQYNRPDYTEGQTTLDNYLMQRNKDYYKQKTEAINAAKNVERSIPATNQALQNKAAETLNKRKEFQTNAKSYFNDAYNSLLNYYQGGQISNPNVVGGSGDPINTQGLVSNKNEVGGRLQAKINELMPLINSNDISALNKLGIGYDPTLGIDNGAMTYGINLSDYINVPSVRTEYGIGDIISQEDFNKAQDLAAILGVDSFVDKRTPYAQEDISFDYDKLKSDYEAKKKGYEDWYYRTTMFPEFLRSERPDLFGRYFAGKGDYERTPDQWIRDVKSSEDIQKNWDADLQQKFFDSILNVSPYDRTSKFTKS